MDKTILQWFSWNKEETPSEKLQREREQVFLLAVADQNLKIKFDGSYCYQFVTLNTAILIGSSLLYAWIGIAAYNTYWRVKIHSFDEETHKLSSIVKDFQKKQDIIQQRTALLDQITHAQKRFKIPVLVITSYLGFYNGFKLVKKIVNQEATNKITDEMMEL